LVLALHGGPGSARRLPRLEVQLIRTEHRPDTYEHDPAGNARIADANVVNSGPVRH
jgi:hypothetical protein